MDGKNGVNSLHLDALFLAKLSSIFGVMLRFRLFYMQQIDIAAQKSRRLECAYREWFFASVASVSLLVFWFCICHSVGLGSFFALSRQRHKYDGVDFAFPQDGRRCESKSMAI